MEAFEHGKLTAAAVLAKIGELLEKGIQVQFFPTELDDPPERFVEVRLRSVAEGKPSLTAALILDKDNETRLGLLGALSTLEVELALLAETHALEVVFDEPNIHDVDLV